MAILFLLVLGLHLIMSSTLPAHGCSSPVTRVAIFKFKSHVSASQKADRAHAFLGLCGAHRDLLVDMPRGGKSLGRSVMLKDPSQETVNIRGSESDFGFIVEFKARRYLLLGCDCLLNLRRMLKRGTFLIQQRAMRR